MTDFVAFPKIPRLFRDMIVTEKIDGTNAAIVVPEDPAEPVLAQSRKRLITPEQDNFGFASWVYTHAQALREQLGPGYHYGEWWGNGIQRGYGLEKGDKRFSLFAVDRYEDVEWELLPSAIGTVPVLCRRTFDLNIVSRALHQLRITGSQAAPDYMNPEGVIVFHVASRQIFKATLDKNDAGKWEASNVGASHAGNAVGGTWQGGSFKGMDEYTVKL